jgi:predicted aspartyl protease
MIASAASADVPVPDHQGRRLVDVQVDSHGSFPFLIDTAASHTVLYRRFVGEVGLSAIPRRSTRVITATGTREMGFYRVDSVTALGRVLHVGETIAMPDAGGGQDAPYGIIGVDFLAGHVLVVTASEVRLLAAEDFSPAADDAISWHRVPGRAVGRGSVATDVTVAGLTMPAIIDTGAAVTVINRRAVDRLRESHVGAVEFRSSSLSAAAGRMRAETLQVERMTIGEVVLRDRDILASNLPVFATYGAAEVPAMILGADILFSRPVAIDFVNHDLYIGIAKAAAEAE